MFRNNRQPFINMFRRKQNNNGAVWASIISLVVSGVAVFLSSGKKFSPTNFSLPNFAGNNPEKQNIPMMNNALTEFSEEIFSNTGQKR